MLQGSAVAITGATTNGPVSAPAWAEGAASFAQLGFERRQFAGQGEHTIDLAIERPAGWILQAGATLELAIEASPALRPTTSWVAVTINGYDVGSHKLDGGERGRYTFALPADLLNSDGSGGPVRRLALQARFFLDVPQNGCTSPAAPEATWAAILPTSSWSLPHTDAAGLDLARIPLPDDRDEQGEDRGRGAARADRSRTHGGLTLLAAIGRHTPGTVTAERLPRLVTADQLTDADRGASHLILIGGPERNAQSAAAVKSVGDLFTAADPAVYRPGDGERRGILRLANSPFGNGNILLAVSGNSPEGLTLAANALLQSTTLGQLRGKAAVIVATIGPQQIVSADNPGTAPTALAPQVRTPERAPENLASDRRDRPRCALHGDSAAGWGVATPPPRGLGGGMAINVERSELTYREPYPGAGRLPRWLAVIVPKDTVARAGLRLGLLRVIIATTLLLGTYYLTWRYTSTINWAAWWVAIPLLLAETYSFVDAWLFGISMWNWRGARPKPPAPPPGLTVDIFITCYNEPVELVRKTARAAKRDPLPARTWILDDGAAGPMQRRGRRGGHRLHHPLQGVAGSARHAKAGNLNNACSQTDGEFMLILDADQIPAPEILDHTLGYFTDPKVGFVQTPQFFYNVPPHDPFGAQAPLFYGPIQQGKDGWNAAFFCGSNAMLRREALMLHRRRLLRARARNRASRRRSEDSGPAAAPGGERATPEGRSRGRARAGLRRTALRREGCQTGAAEAPTDPGDHLGVPTPRRALSRATWSPRTSRDPRRTGRIGAGLEDLEFDEGLALATQDEETMSALAGRGGGSPMLAIAAVRNSAPAMWMWTVPKRSSR